MAFETRRIYRPVDGAEFREIMVRRLKQALDSDSVLHVARAFPLFRYEISVKLFPYHSSGTAQPVPDTPLQYEVDGEFFVPVLDQALELVEESPVYGQTADPQDLRREVGMGTIETARTNTGELVDVRTKPGRPQETVPMPAVKIEEPQSWPAPKPGPVETEEETLAAEQARWTGAHTDPLAERAVAANLGQGDPSLAPGRVSVIRSVTQGGGADHGRWKK